jgi:hypothetical protein
MAWEFHILYKNNGEPHVVLYDRSEGGTIKAAFGTWLCEATKHRHCNSGFMDWLMDYEHKNDSYKELVTVKLTSEEASKIVPDRFDDEEDEDEVIERGA